MPHVDAGAGVDVDVGRCGRPRVHAQYTSDGLAAVQVRRSALLGCVDCCDCCDCCDCSTAQYHAVLLLLLWHSATLTPRTVQAARMERTATLVSAPDT